MLVEGFESKRRRFLKLHPNFKRGKHFKGVAWHQSIYYYYIEFLKLSEEYKATVENTGSSEQHLMHLYEDFGDIYSVNFKSWWLNSKEYINSKGELESTTQGKYCFAEAALLLPTQNATYDEIEEHKSEIQSGEVFALLLDAHATKTDLNRRAATLISRYVAKRSEQVRNQSSARYKINEYTKNNVKTLRQGIRALQLEQANYKRWEIGAILQVDDLLMRKELQKHSNLLPCNADYKFPQYNEKNLHNDIRFSNQLFNKEPQKYSHLVPITDIGSDNLTRRNHLSNNAKRAIDTARANISAVLNTTRKDGELGFGKFPVSA